MNVPFIKKLKVGNNYYIYDVNSNNILRCDEKIYNMIDTSYWNTNEKIIEFQKKGIFSLKRPKKIVPPFSFEEMRKILENDLVGISMFISDNCNLKCKYCFFSNNYYKTISRPLKNNLMHFPMAKKILDFYLNHSENSERKIITFYGGEPLLNFKVIKKSIEYIKEKLKDYTKEIIFSFTTNLYTITDEEIEFIINNNIRLAVSLDGPKDIHNKFRLDKTGKGTFDVVMKNLNKIKDKNIEFFKKNVGFISVATGGTDIEKVAKFFTEYFSENVSVKIGGLSFLPMNETSEFYGFKYSPNYKNEEFLYNEYKDCKIKGKSQISHNVLFDFYEIEFSKIHNRFMIPLGEIFYSSSGCTPGQLRPLVDVNGSIFLCEKTGFTFHIGDVINGFDYEKCYRLMEEFALIRDEICRDCWALRFCGVCYLYGIDEEGKLNKGRLIEMCKKEKRAYEVLLRRYIEIREKKMDAFDNLRKNE